MEFAEENHINILIETESTIGKIRLTTPFLHSELLRNINDRNLLSALINTANSFMIQSQNDLLQLDFDFRLTTPIEK